MAKWLMAIPPVLFLALAGMFWAGMHRQNPGELPSVFVGQPAPPLGGETLPGIPGVTNAELTQGKLTVVNFWASWCPPCRAEHPTLTALSADLPVYGVDLKDPEAQAIRFLDEHGDPFHAIATDPNGRGAIDWGVTAPPETFIVDGTGKVLFRFAGPLVREDYTNRFLPQLEAALAAE